MAQKENKTTQNENSVADYIATIKDAKKKQDFSTLVDLIAKEMKFPAKMWGNAIVGFGSYHYKYESGREGDAPLAGLSSRATSITVYLSDVKNQGESFKILGKHKLSGSCLHFKTLDDIDIKVLMKMIKHSAKHTKAMYPG